MVVEIQEINPAEGCLDKYSITIARIGLVIILVLVIEWL